MESWGVANHCKWTDKWWDRPKDRTESEGQALREDGKSGVKLSKVTKNKETNVIWLQT